MKSKPSQENSFAQPTIHPQVNKEKVKSSRKNSSFAVLNKYCPNTQDFYSVTNQILYLRTISNFVHFEKMNIPIWAGISFLVSEKYY